MSASEALLILLAVGAAGLYFWHSGAFKGRARELATAHCRELGLQLLDQSMVITGFWPLRAADGRMTFRRTYQFEFSSTGDRRYRGVIVLVGRDAESIELEAYRLPGDD